MKTITAIYQGKRLRDSGSDSTMDYYVYEFSNVRDSEGSELGPKWIKETELTKNFNFIQGELYVLTFSKSYEETSSRKLPFPIAIQWNDQKVYLKNGNQIIRVNNDRSETNLSVSRKLIPELSSYEMGIFNKFLKGILTLEMLKKMNDRKIYFSINLTDPQDKRKTHSTSYSYNRDPSKGNYILIQQETQNMIESYLQYIKTNILSTETEPHFTLKTSILAKKKQLK
jgi:hypothetical protein